MLFWSAFILGIAGTLHCVGMCGPIALALPVHQRNIGGKLLGISLYNAGRISIYMLFGAVFGTFGAGLELSGLQQYLSIVLGATIIALVLFPRLFTRFGLSKHVRIPWINQLKSGFQRRFSNKSFGSLFVLGTLNGLLPCGLVYMAVAGSLTTTSALGGALYMGLFGLGTLPVMMAMPFIGSLKGIGLRVKRMIPVLAILFGVLLVLRGSNLGIPYISPQMNHTESCCKIKCH